MQTYELCSDMIDVVIDVSCIYGYFKKRAGSCGMIYDLSGRLPPTPPSPLPSPLVKEVSYEDEEPQQPQQQQQQSSPPPPPLSSQPQDSADVQPQPSSPSLPAPIIPYDENSHALIRLNNGMVLYLREVNSYLALVCLFRGDNFSQKHGLMEFNFQRFKDAIQEVFAIGNRG